MVGWRFLSARRSAPVYGLARLGEAKKYYPTLISQFYYVILGQARKEIIQPIPLPAVYVEKDLKCQF